MSTQLRELFDDAAESQPPSGLAARAVAGARRRRRQRYTVAGSVLAAAAVVLGFVMVSSSERLDGVPRPQDVASLPDELPAPDGLPTLVAGTMDAASAAYVVDDQLVFVDAATGEGAVWSSLDDLAGLQTITVDSDALSPYQVRLSPDGVTALVALGLQAPDPPLGFAIVVLDLPTAQGSLEDLRLSDAITGPGWLEHNLMAWAPDSKSAYCVCLDRSGTNPDLGVWSITVGDNPIDTFYAQVSDLAPPQLSAGVGGLLAVQVEPSRGDWELRTDDYLNRGAVGPAESLALSHEVPTTFAGVTNVGYAIQDFTVLTRLVQWQRLPAGPVSSIQAMHSDFVLVSRPLDAPPGEPPPPSPLVAHLLTPNAPPLAITTFPTGTTSTSFAADVDAIG